VSRTKRTLNHGINFRLREPSIQCARIGYVQLGAAGCMHVVALSQIFDQITTDESATTGEEDPHRVLLPGIGSDPFGWDLAAT
jgi:hypothetical protein